MLIAVPLVLALFMDRQMTVEKDITINKPAREVFKYIKYLKNQDNFSKWAKMDPNMKKEYRGIDGATGFASSWESDDRNAGKGEQEIKSIIEGERIDFELRFKEPCESTDTACIITESVADKQTRVKGDLRER